MRSGPLRLSVLAGLAGTVGVAIAAGPVAADAAGPAAAAPPAPVESAARPLAFTPQGERTGGDTTVFADGQQAFGLVVANGSDDDQRRFVIGNSFFRRNWVVAPSSTRARDGLGPHFIARSCGGCHLFDGRGAPPRDGEPPVALLFRLSVPGTPDPHLGVRPDPVYGDQLTNAAIPGVPPEGQIDIGHEPVRVDFADGSHHTLQRPVYRFRDLQYGPMGEGVMVSPRIAPQLIGIGLIEAIPEQDILENARRQAGQPGPVKGQVNRVWDSVLSATQPGPTWVGRFGWKSNVATLAHQTAAAFLGDMGITSSYFPQQNCSDRQTACRKAPAGAHPGEPEVSDSILADVVFYMATLAPPARRHAEDPQVQAGERLFHDVGCAQCHRPSYVTGESPIPSMTSTALKRQTIWPYTDLLLHDMGAGLADGRPDHDASGQQWRTPPLWGIGLFHAVNGHQRLLHDGRADGVEEAILWHGGEAAGQQERYRQLSRADREALVRFVESL